MNAPHATLVLGGARSGKSRIAEDMVLAAADAGAEKPVYIAAAHADDNDDEMQARIAAHQARRGGAWETVEAHLDLPVVLARHAGRAILADCLTIWLANLMHSGRDYDAAAEALCAVLASARAPVVLVSNEVGQGIVPDNALARRFRDAAGVMNQRVASSCARVVFVTAGLAQVLKDDTA